jgi:four helix bundle protein
MIKNLDEFNVYNLSLELADEVWKLVQKWNYFEKDTIGKQLVRAVDSISANLSEGLGRYHFKESKNFGYYARGSLFETKTWLVKAKNRELWSEEIFNNLISKLDVLGKRLNTYIKSIGDVSEPYESYGEENI